MISGRRRVVVTGMGTVNPLGNDVATTWCAAQDGVCGIAPITLYDPGDMQVGLAGEVKDLTVTDYLDKRDARKYDRFTQFAIIASMQAFADSGLVMEHEDPYRCGCLISSGIGGLDVIAQEQMKGVSSGFDRVSPHFIPTVITNIAAGSVAIHLGLRGMCECVVTACAGGTHAIGEGFHAIGNGYADVMVVGGTEACVTPLAVGGFTSMKALTHESDITRASIPFDAERSGFVIGEGAGMLVLEELEHARARGARIYAEVEGYGATCDAYHLTAPAPDASGAIVCMENALKESGLIASDIGYLNAHGTSTPAGDRCEARAIGEVFGDYADKLPVSSTKSMTGHMLGATGAVEAILSICALKDGFLPPNIHYEVPDEDCALDIVANVGRTATISHVMSNTFGFGGQNATIVFGKTGV